MKAMSVIVSKRMRVVMMMGVVAVMSIQGFAAFVNGVETFDGTSPDNQTWEAYTGSNAGSLSQNDCLKLYSNGNGIKLDYTTKAVTVGIGDSVSAKVKFAEDFSGWGTGYFGLFLTNNSQGTTERTVDDTRWIGICKIQNMSGAIWAGKSDSTVNGAWTENITAPNTQTAGQTLIYKIERTSAMEARCSVWDLNGGQIGGYSILSLADMPGELYVSFHNHECKTVYDDVTLVPEPATLIMMTAGSLFLRRKK